MRRMWGAGFAVAATALIVLIAVSGPAAAQGGGGGGPVNLMGIDAEDGGPNGHGPTSVYGDIVDSIFAEIRRPGQDAVIIGAGKAPTDDVTRFWDAVAADTGRTFTYVNGAAGITALDLSGVRFLGIASGVAETPSGGLTQEEADALAARSNEIASFVNSGGGLLGFSQTGINPPYAYITGIAGANAFAFNTGLSFSDITPTPEGQQVGITDALDVCCWHDEVTRFPSFLRVLATNTASGAATAVGGASTRIQPAGNECAGQPATIVGTPGKDTLTGTGGPDVIAGRGGNDVIEGVGDDDRLCGNSGNDQVDGGSGDDFVRGNPDKDRVNGGPGNDNARGGRGDDRVDGDDGDDRLRGNPGDDHLVGGDGRDRCNGDSGNDTEQGCEITGRFFP